MFEDDGGIRGVSVHYLQPFHIFWSKVDTVHMGSFNYIVFCWVSTLSRRSVLIFKGESETQTHQGDGCDVLNEPLLARSKQKHWADTTIAGVWRLLSVSDGVRSCNSRFFLSVLAANCCRGALNPVIAGCSLPNIAASLHHFHNPEMPLHTHTCRHDYTWISPIHSLICYGHSVAIFLCQ